MGAVAGATPAQIANTATVVFGAAIADWGTFTDVGIFDAAAGGKTCTEAEAVGDAAPVPNGFSTVSLFDHHRGQCL